MVKKTTLALGALAVTVLMTACGRADGSGNTAAQEPTESIMQTDIVQSGTENGSSGTTEITGNTQNSTGEAASEAPGRIPDKPSEELTCPLHHTAPPEPLVLRTHCRRSSLSQSPYWQLYPYCPSAPVLPQG